MSAERAERFWNRLVEIWDAAPEDDWPSDEIFNLIQAFKAGEEPPSSDKIRKHVIAFAAGMRFVGKEWEEIAEFVKVPLDRLQPLVERWLENPRAVIAFRNGTRVVNEPEYISKESLHREGLHQEKPMPGCRLCKEQR
jgi:hypothetical protein